MKQMMLAGTLMVLVLTSLTSRATMIVCPDPETSSLKWGEPPKPWVVNPYSPRPQADASTRFAHANILVAAGMGLGVVCTYKNSRGLYSIWWQVRAKVPPQIDYRWINTNGGFVCTDSLESCQFSVDIF